MRVNFRAQVQIDPLIAAGERAGNLEPYMKVGGAQRVRFGDGSVDQQFEGAFTFGDSRVPWVRTKDFGTRPAPRRTLQDTGKLREAWLGFGPGGVVNAGARHVDVGVDSGVLPYAAVFQAERPTVQRVTGKQRMYLGLAFGVWLKPGQTITTHPRRVSANAVMAKRVGEGAAVYIVSGDVTGGEQRGA